ncbi:catalase, partial [Pseudoalteromonas sp. S3260]
RDSEGSEEQSSEQQQQQREQEQQQIQELAERDREVRTHEQAHASVGGQYAGSPSYDYQRGPDGKNYAVGGEVQIDVGEVPGDPQATIEKMQQVRSAALAPAEPSGA